MKLKVNLPTTVTVVLSLIAGVLVAFNQASFDFATEWTVAITVGVTGLAAWGISPLTGSAFRAVLHLPNAVSVGIAVVLGAAQVVFITVSISPALHGIIAGVLAFAAGLGFAPAIPLGVGDKQSGTEAKLNPNPREVFTRRSK